MSLYRLLARDHLKEGEVRLYDQPHVGDRSGTGDSHPPPLQEVRYESLDLVDLGHHLLLLAAQEKAQTLVAQAQSEAQRIYENARESGNQQGREEAKQDILPSIVAFGHAGQMLIVFEEQMVTRYAPQIAGFALDIAEKVIGHAVAENPEIVASVLERAKREVAEAKQMRIWLHPADHKILAETRPELIKIGSETGRTIEVVASEDVTRGGCRLETEMGLVDATLPTQIDEIRRQLLDELPSQNSGPRAHDDKPS
jgi:flagellar biosynthesis/type III secretory pathway protein FliH